MNNNFDDDFLPPPAAALKPSTPAQELGDPIFTAPDVALHTDEIAPQSTADLPPGLASFESDHLLVQATATTPSIEDQPAVLPAIQFNIAAPIPQSAIPPIANEAPSSHFAEQPLSPTPQLTLDDLQPQVHSNVDTPISAPLDEPIAAAQKTKSAKSGLASKIKPIHIGMLLVVVAVGWNYHKKQVALEATQQAAVAPSPYKDALKQMQDSATGAPGPADTKDPMDAFFAENSSENAELPQPLTNNADAFGQPALPAVAAQQSAPSPAVTLVTSATDTSTADVQKLKSDMAASEAKVTELSQKLATSESEKQKLETELKDWRTGKLTVSATTSPVKASVSPEKTPEKNQAKPVVAKVPARISTPAKTSTAAAPKQAVASEKRSDITWLGSFRENSTVMAHTLIGSTVYKVQAGQKIAGVSIDSVSMEGVKINGQTYGN